MLGGVSAEWTAGRRPCGPARASAYDVDAVRQAYGEKGKALSEFGRDNLIPTPFDPRLLVYIAPEVVRAAQKAGVATRPVADLEAYARGLTSFVYRTNTFMGRLYQRAAKKPRWGVAVQLVVIIV